MIRKCLYVLQVLEACLFFAIACSSSGAQGGNRTIAQFAHTAWGAKDGAPRPIRALAQGSDGYLWLGSTNGLYRFDGITFERYQPASGRPIPGGFGDITVSSSQWRSLDSLFAWSDQPSAKRERDELYSSRRVTKSVDLGLCPGLGRDYLGCDR